MSSSKKDQNKDGENNFEDVKIARMKASGMSDAEIKKKHPELFENKKSNHPKQYKAPEGSKRDKSLDRAKELYKKGDIEGAVRAREREEKRQQKLGVKSRPRKDTGKWTSKKESVEDSVLRSYIRELLYEEILEEKKKKKKKRKSSSGKLSAKTKATLKKKAEKRGLTPGSVYAEYRKGLAAWVSSGSRKGMSQHQWAHARVNSATPSKSWAVVKKSKAKKKK